MAAVLIRQFDVFRNEGRNARAYPYVVVLQSDAVDEGRSIVVAPLVRNSVSGHSRLAPLVVVEGEPWTLVVADLASMPRTYLRDPVTNRDGERRRIVAALDLPFTGV